MEDKEIILTPEELAQWVYDNRYSKGEGQTISNFELYHFIKEQAERQTWIYFRALRSHIFPSVLTKTKEKGFQFSYTDEEDKNQHSEFFKTKEECEEAFIKFHQDRHYEWMEQTSVIKHQSLSILNQAEKFRSFIRTNHLTRKWDDFNEVNNFYNILQEKMGDTELKENKYDSEGYLENMDVGDWIVTKDCRIIKITSDNMSDLHYKDIKRFATAEEIFLGYVK